MKETPNPLPGKSGVLANDDTLIFLKNPFKYIQKGIAKHGNVYKSRLMLKDVVVMAGPEAGQKFNDESFVRRAGAFPPFIEKLFGGKSLPFQDGGTHRERKQLILEGFTMQALQAYLPDMQEIVEANLKEWASLGEFDMLPGLKDLAFEVVCANVLGMRRGGQLKQLQSDYDAVTAGLVSLPVQLPGLPYDKAIRARDHIFEKLRFLVELRWNAPTGDAVSRMLSARTPEGNQLSIDEAVLEVHHAMIAGYIVYGELAALMCDLSRERALRKRLKDEVDTLLTGAIRMEDLGRLSYLGQFVMEVKRLCPIVAAQFGKACKDFEVYGCKVPKGWMILWALHASNRDPEIYTDPEQFDPGRFSPRRAEHLAHAFAYVPQGGGEPTGHRCAGIDYSAQLMEVFTIALLRSYKWKLLNAEPELDWGLNPPQPVGGLKVTVSPA